MLLILSLLIFHLKYVVESTNIPIPVHRFFCIASLEAFVIAFIGPNQEALDVVRQHLNLCSAEHSLHSDHLLF